ncbi:hypothetical protein T484DRAFT_1860727 [Baffinella frigidus]|nr:hypothetical protein T484DRAFT_1860727 [Cryptophyta sp. CCMP2293]
MAYFSLMTELEALEQAAAARAPRYMQKFGASDEVFYAKMRLALQSIKPASDCTEGKPASDLRDRDREKRLSAADDSLFAYLRHALETANEPHDHAALPPPYRVTRQSRQSPFSSPRTASAESTTAPHASAEANKLRRFDGSPGGKAHPFRQGMLNRWICALDDAVGPPLPVGGSFGPSTTAQRSASDRRNSVSGTETPPIAVAPGNLRPALRVVPEHFLRFLDRLRHALPAHDFGHGVLIRWSLRFIELPA